MNLFAAGRQTLRFIKRRRRGSKNRRAIESRPEIFAVHPDGDDRYCAALYFADPVTNLYQIRQWYGPLERLAEDLPLVIIARNSRTAMIIEEETSLPVFYGRTIGDIESLLATQDIAQVFYVNQNMRNFQMMRFQDPAHVFICHGESEKAYMWSNQLKAYDYVFTAGPAAQERLQEHLIGFDVNTRTHNVGRPQIDVPSVAPYALNSNYPTVLYAPTWEGDRPSMAYGSVTSHGISAIAALVDSQRYNVIFRPHPRSGVNIPDYRADVARLRKLLQDHQGDGPSYIFDDSPQWGWQWGSADVCIADVSAVAYDWMATSKPLLVTTPVSPEAEMADSPALAQVPQLDANAATNVVQRIDHMLKDPAVTTDYRSLVAHYFGDTAPGKSMQRFLDASRQIDRSRRHEVRTLDGEGTQPPTA